MSLVDVVEGLEEALADALDVNVYGADLSSPTPPCVVVSYPEAVDLEAAFQGIATYTMPLLVILPLTSAREARLKGDELVSSVVDAITIDPTLGGRVHSSAPVDVTRYSLSPNEGPTVLQFTIRVQVMA